MADIRAFSSEMREFKMENTNDLIKMQLHRITDLENKNKALKKDNDVLRENNELLKFNREVLVEDKRMLEEYIDGLKNSLKLEPKKEV